MGIDTTVLYNNRTTVYSDDECVLVDRVIQLYTLTVTWLYL